MSYGSTFIQFEANGRISNRFSRPSYKKEEHDSPPKLVQYEKQFDVNLTRVDDNAKVKSNMKDSMVAYTRKMRTIQDSRYQASNTGKDDPLFVRAKHIPKYPSKPPKKRRPMSFDELLGRDRDASKDRPGAARNRPQSDKGKPAHARDVERKSDNELHLPLLTDRLRKSGNVQVSLVSASDLYEIVDLSIRSKATRNESLQMLRMEREIKSRRKETPRIANHSNDSYKDLNKKDPYDAYERTNDRSFEVASKERKLRDSRNYSFDMSDDIDEEDQLPSEDFYAEIFNMDKVEPSLKKQPTVNMFSPLRLPTHSIDQFRRRPNRAKRMKLMDSGLGDIPEDNVIESRGPSNEQKREPARISSPTPQKLSPRLPESPNKQFLDAIQETSNRDNEKLNESNEESDITHEDIESVSEFSRVQEPQETAVNDKTHYSGMLPLIDESKSTKKVLHDDGDVRIEVTQCPPKNENVSNKLKAQKRFKKLIFLRDGSR